MGFNSAFKGLKMLICAILLALVTCTKCIKDQQRHLKFIYMLLLSYGHQHV